MVVAIFMRWDVLMTTKDNKTVSPFDPRCKIENREQGKGAGFLQGGRVG